MQPLLRSVKLVLFGKESGGVMERREEQKQQNIWIYRRAEITISAMKRGITMIAGEMSGQNKN